MRLIPRVLPDSVKGDGAERGAVGNIKVRLLPSGSVKLVLHLQTWMRAQQPCTNTHRVGQTDRLTVVRVENNTILNK